MGDWWGEVSWNPGNPDTSGHMVEEPEEQQAQQTQESEEDRDPGGRGSRCTQGGNLSAGAQRLETRCEAQVLGGAGWIPEESCQTESRI